MIFPKHEDPSCPRDGIIERAERKSAEILAHMKLSFLFINKCIRTILIINFMHILLTIPTRSELRRRPTFS